MKELVGEGEYKRGDASVIDNDGTWEQVQFGVFEYYIRVLPDVPENYKAYVVIGDKRVQIVGEENLH